jgi:hypothetical protein
MKLHYDLNEYEATTFFIYEPGMKSPTWEQSLLWETAPGLYDEKHFERIGFYRHSNVLKILSR